MTKVSYFESAYNQNVTKEVSLFKWLQWTVQPPKDLENLVLRYRTLRTDSAKKAIPCVTISARFKKVRNLKKVKEETGYLCIDVDAKENPVADMELIKKLICKHYACAYIGYSVSGNGIYAIFKVHEKEKHSKVFKFLKKALKEKGIIIDKQCGDVSRLRFFSLDEEAYINKDAKPFRLPKKKIRRGNYQSTGDVSIIERERRKVESIVALVQSSGVDITGGTDGYANWVKVAASLNGMFGEGGRSYFHELSKNHKDYKAKACDRKYDQCSNMTGYGISSLYYLAGQYGLKYKQ